MMAIRTLVFATMSVVLAASVHGSRSRRHMMDRNRSPNSLAVVQYPLCSVGGVEAACLSGKRCDQQQGRYAGNCHQHHLVCCIVEKTCGAVTSSHSVTFRNPSYPRHDDTPVLCPLKLRLGRKVCAVRVDLTVLELAKYEDGVCIRDTLTLLGSTEGIATPVCGNMTGFATTFPVKELGEVTVSLVAQAKHRFSITLSQLNCDDVPKFISPTYAGVRNADAKKYIPPPTTKKPPKKKGGIVNIKSTSTDEPTTDETTTVEAGTEQPDDVSTVTPMGPVIRETGTDETDDMEQTTQETTTEGRDDVEDDEKETARSSQEQTTLKVGKYPRRTTTPTPEVIIRVPLSEDEEQEEVEIENVGDDSEDQGFYTETIDVTPSISGFKRAFELKVQDRCWLYEQEQEEPDSFRVIGGYRTNIHEYPWQVALVYGKKFFCGGSLISDRFVLTAAHCVFGAFSRGIDKLRVSLGDHDLSTKNDTVNVVSKVRRVIWHLHYSPHINVNDIALMELAEPVNFNYSVSAIKLPFDSEDQFGGQNATVTGWGRYSIKTKKTSPILKEYTGPLVLGEKCVKSWKKFPTISAYADKHLCLGVKMGTPCHGDSGGPLVVCTGNSCTQVGLVSFGFPLCTNVGLPAVFTRMTYYRPWLDRNLAPLNARPV